ncbi:hypothetical protein [Janthinobacterium sp. JC611]|uniref:hypothetical protein n=1 Tax=Janthinobacterium sp. JC611 TaxID=2816201 RepID=UPI001BFE5576|nr:hypothetical protein [Janthinobacterium sp. JC611]
MKDARDAGDLAEAAKWEEGGVYRVAAHTAAGALAGGVGGALGAGASAAAMPKIGEMIDGMDLPEPVKQALGAAAATSIGAAAGGVAGAATAFNTDVNNRMLHPGDRQKAKALAELSKGKYTEKQILDAMRYSGLRDEAGNIVVTENTQETFVRNVDIKTGKTIQETLAADNTMSLVSVPGDQVTLLEKAPTRPSNDLMAYITANTGGKSSPYVLTPRPTYVTNQSLPTAPEGTKRVTMTVEGAVYFPLVAPCPAVSCTNGDPIANAIPDAGTKAYNEAVARKTEKEVEIFTAVLGLGGAAIRGAGAIVNLATKTSAVARGAELAGLSSVNAAAADGFAPFRSKLGFDFETNLTPTPNGSFISLSSRQVVLEDGSIVLQKSGAPASEFRGTFNSKTGNLNVDWMGSAQQGNGLGTEMMSRAVENIGPSNVRSISGRLDELNKSLFNEYYNEIGYDITQSISKIPAGKIRKSIGYGDLQYSNGVITGSKK